MDAVLHDGVHSACFPMCFKAEQAFDNHGVISMIKNESHVGIFGCIRQTYEYMHRAMQTRLAHDIIVLHTLLELDYKARIRSKARLCIPASLSYR